MRAALASLVLVAACRASAPAPAPAPAAVVGTWEGPSICQVHPSPCHDEDAVYVFSTSGGRLVLDGQKRVDGVAESMGPLLPCTLTAAHVRCTMPKGSIELDLDGDRLRGSMLLSDGTEYRTLDLTRH